MQGARKGALIISWSWRELCDLSCPRGLIWSLSQQRCIAAQVASVALTLFDARVFWNIQDVGDNVLFSRGQDKVTFIDFGLWGTYQSYMAHSPKWGSCSLACILAMGCQRILARVSLSAPMSYKLESREDLVHWLEEVKAGQVVQTAL